MKRLNVWQHLCSTSCRRGKRTSETQPCCTLSNLLAALLPGRIMWRNCQITWHAQFRVCLIQMYNGTSRYASSYPVAQQVNILQPYGTYTVTSCILLQNCLRMFSHMYEILLHTLDCMQKMALLQTNACLSYVGILNQQLLAGGAIALYLVPIFIPTFVRRGNRAW